MTGRSIDAVIDEIERDLNIDVQNLSLHHANKFDFAGKDRSRDAGRATSVDEQERLYTEALRNRIVAAWVYEDKGRLREAGFSWDRAAQSAQQLMDALLVAQTRERAYECFVKDGDAYNASFSLVQSARYWTIMARDTDKRHYQKAQELLENLDRIKPIPDVVQMDAEQVGQRIKYETMPDEKLADEVESIFECSLSLRKKDIVEMKRSGKAYINNKWICHGIIVLCHVARAYERRHPLRAKRIVHKLLRECPQDKKATADALLKVYKSMSGCQYDT